MKRIGFQKSLKKIKKAISASSFSQKSHTSSPDLMKEEKSGCMCKDAQGNPKILYPSQQEAEEARNNLHLPLHIYPCPSEKGWHLTKG